MTTILFVHGTGVRRKAYERSLALVREGISRRCDDVTVAPCLWGDELGAKLGAEGMSVPTYGSTRGPGGPGAVTDEEVEIARWSRLYRDPEAELEMLLLKGGEEEGHPGAGMPAERVQRDFAGLEATGPLDEVLVRLDLREVFEVARDDLAASPTLRGLAVSAVSGSELRRTLARALTARALAERAALEPDAPWPDAAERDALVGAVATALGGADRGVGDWLGGCFKSFGSHLATFYATRKRRSVTDGASPVVGDILLYQSRGEAIRRFIAEEVAASGATWILAHSLGGIASFELLVQQELPGIEGLVTVGSQAPWFYEIDALKSLRFETKQLPDHFPRWLNVYDRRDLLSYVGGRLFRDRCLDLRVDNGQPFPAAHSAYWSNDEVFQAIADELEGRAP